MVQIREGAQVSNDHHEEAVDQVARNPLPWLDDMLNAVEHTNFFENRATEYSKASTTGTWEEAFAEATFESPQPGGPVLPLQ